MLASIPAGTEPQNEAKAWGSPNWPPLQGTMVKEVSELTSKQTWEVVDALPNTNIVGSQWTYHLKHNVNRTIACYKACLVAQGFTQAAGVNYSETFTPVAKFASNCIVIALATHNNWEVHQVDIKNAYLNVELMEAILHEAGAQLRASWEQGTCMPAIQSPVHPQAGQALLVHWICKEFAKFTYIWCMAEHCVFHKRIGGKPSLWLSQSMT